MNITNTQKERALKLGLKNLSLTNHKNLITKEYDKYLLTFFNTNINKLQSVYIDKCFYSSEINKFLGLKEF